MPCPVLGADIFMDRTHQMSQLGTYLLFYGLYFGVMGRDFAEVRPVPANTQYSCSQSLLLDTVAGGG